MRQTLPITVIVHTRNSAGTLTACLQSVPSVAELLVVDMGSTDESLLIARQFHARTLSVEDTGFVEPARAKAIAAATQPWILILDADEELPRAVQDWLPDLLEQNQTAVYALPRRNLIFGKALAHTGWWPDYQIRLFLQGAVSWPSQIHAQPVCTQKPTQLPATAQYAIVHHNYATIAQFIERLNRYTTIEASATSPGPLTDREWLTLYANELFARLAAQEGWRDGEQGLAAALLQAMYPLVTALKQWEAGGWPSQSEFRLRLSQQYAALTKTVAYWRASYELEHARGWRTFYWKLRRKFRL